MTDHYRIITDNSEFRDLAVRLAEEPRYAIDTEFHREITGDALIGGKMM